MFNSKHKQNLIFNNNLPIFGIFVFCSIIYLGFVIDYWYLLLGVLLPLTINDWHLKWQQWTFCVCVILMFIILTIVAHDFSLFSLILNNNNNVLRKLALNYLDSSYTQQTSDFIKLILFNVKTNQTYVFYRQVVDLGIVWLVCISGFHISLIVNLIKKLLKKKQKIAKYVNIAIVTFYSCLLNLSYGTIRIVIKLSLDWAFQRFYINKYNKLGAIGLIICFLNPSCFSNIGFLLSFSICIVAYYVSSLNLNNRIISSLLLNFLAFIVSIPFVVEMNNKISLLTFLNCFIFIYYFAFLFLYFLFFAWIPNFEILHSLIVQLSFILVGNISFANIYIFCNKWASWIQSIYYLLIIPLGKLLYLIVINNKI